MKNLLLIFFAKEEGMGKENDEDGGDGGDGQK